MPRWANGDESLALSAARMMSQARAMPSPMPIAAPLTAAIVGLGQWKIAASMGFTWLWMVS